MNDADLKEARLDELERRLASFARDHGAANSETILALVARLAEVRGKISADIGAGRTLSAIGHEFERDITGLSEQIRTLIIDGGRT